MAEPVPDLVRPPTLPSPAASQPQRATEAAHSNGKYLGVRAGNPCPCSGCIPQCAPGQLTSGQMAFDKPLANSKMGWAKEANGHKTGSDLGGILDKKGVV